MSRWVHTVAVTEGREDHRSRSWHRLLITALLQLAVASQAYGLAGGAAQGACASDCDGDGQATVSELLTAARIVLGQAPQSACSTFHGQGVDSLVSAVHDVLRGCSPATVTSAAAASGVALSAINSTIPSILDFGFIGGAAAAGGQDTIQLANAALRSASAAAPPSGRASGAVFLPCNLGGDVGLACISEFDGSLTLTASFFSCMYLDDFGSFTELDGDLAQNPVDFSVCSGSGSLFQIPVVGTTTFLYGDVRPGSSELEIFSEQGGANADYFVDLVRIVTTSGTIGCAGPDRRETYAGLIDLSTSTPDGDLETTLMTDGLSVLIVSITQPCGTATQLDGDLNVDNSLANGDFERFTETFEQFRLATIESDNRIQRALEGAITTSCLGRIVVHTPTDLVFDPNQTCPSAGELQIQSAQGVSNFQFTATGGVRIDANGDHVFEAQLTSCQDATVNQCPDQVSSLATATQTAPHR